MPAPAVTAPGTRPTSAACSGQAGRLVGVAASSAVTALLDPTGTSGTVRVCGRLAAYLALGDEVVAVVSADAVAPPVSVVLPRGVAPDDLLRPGDPVLADGRGLLLRPGGPAPVLLRPTRWWQPARVHPGPPDPLALRAFAGALAALPDPPPDVVAARAAGPRAAAALVTGSADRAAAELCAVLGLGPGTTPSGDDVAAGLLLAARALLPASHREAMEHVATAVVSAARTRTGCASRAMLAGARRGCAPAVVVHAVDALAGRGDAPAAVARLLTLGHHSGADLASGATALAMVASPGRTIGTAS